MKKFTIIDYIIIILVICAIAFAFIHITSDSSANIQKTAFDASTINKIPSTYSDYYKDGYIVKTTVNGFNSSNNEEVTINGTVEWIGEGTGDINVLIDCENETYLAGLYKDVPNADIYIKTISLETDGSKYENLTEFTINPEEITSLNDLSKNLTWYDCEISTSVSLESVDSVKAQEITNKLFSNNKRLSVNIDPSYKHIMLEKATVQNIDDADSVLGNINGMTGIITIRVYNCSESQIEQIKNNYNVTNIRNF